MNVFYFLYLFRLSFLCNFLTLHSVQLMTYLKGFLECEKVGVLTLPVKLIDLCNNVLITWSVLRNKSFRKKNTKKVTVLN